MKFDRVQYLAWQDRINKNKTLRWLLNAVGVYSVFVFFGILVYLGYHNPKTLLTVLLAFILARVIVVAVVNRFFKKQKPFQKFNFVPITARLFSPLDDHPDSFPSQHIISLAAISVAFWHFSLFLAIFGLVITLMTGVARIIIGHHYPFDVLGGLVLGAACGAIALIFTR